MCKESHDDDDDDDPSFGILVTYVCGKLLNRPRWVFNSSNYKSIVHIFKFFYKNPICPPLAHLIFLQKFWALPRLFFSGYPYNHIHPLWESQHSYWLSGRKLQPITFYLGFISHPLVSTRYHCGLSLAFVCCLDENCITALYVDEKRTSWLSWRMIIVEESSQARWLPWMVSMFMCLDYS